MNEACLRSPRTGNILLAVFLVAVSVLVPAAIFAQRYTPAPTVYVHTLTCPSTTSFRICQGVAFFNTSTGRIDTPFLVIPSTGSSPCAQGVVTCVVGSGLVPAQTVQSIANPPGDLSLYYALCAMAGVSAFVIFLVSVMAYVRCTNEV